MAPTMTPQQLNAYKDKMNSADADFRCMALLDLVREIRSKGTTFAPDEATERTLFTEVQKLIEDPNSEVKNKAVDTLAALIGTAKKNTNITDTIEKLLRQTMGKEEEQRDVATLALKAVLEEIPSGCQVLPDVIEKIVASIVKQVSSPDIPTQHAVELLTILHLLTTHFPRHILSRPTTQTTLLTTLLTLLSSPRGHIRKRAIVALCSLTACSSPRTTDVLGMRIVQVLSGEMGDGESKAAFAMLVGGLAKVVPGMVGGLVGQVVEGIVGLTYTVEDEEALESSMTTLEVLVLRCPTEVTPYLKEIMDRGMTLLKFDPNYAGDEEEEEEDDVMAVDGEDEDMDDEFEDQYSDVEDASWKARRSSAKLLQALLATRPELLPEFYRTLAPLLTSRLSEREDSVRLEVFEAWAVLLKQTAVYGASSGAGGEGWVGSPSGSGLKRKRAGTGESGYDLQSGNPLIAQVPSLSKAILKQSLVKSAATKEKAFSLLKTLVQIVNGGLDTQAQSVATSVHKAFIFSESGSSAGGLSATLTTTVLSFLGSYFKTHSPSVYGDSLVQLVPLVVSSMNDKYQRISLEAFDTASSLAKGLRLGPSSAKNARESMEQIYTATVSTLSSNTADAQVKERALSTLGDLLVFEGTNLSSQYQICLPLITARLGHEATQMAAFKVVGKMAGAENCTGKAFEGWLVEVLQELPILLRRAQKTTKTVALGIIPVLLRRVGKQLKPDDISNLFADLKVFLSDSDLVNLPLAIQSVSALLQAHPKAKTIFADQQLLDTVISLVKSSLVHGIALDALLQFFAGYVVLVPSSLEGLLFKLITAVGSSQQVPSATEGGTQVFVTVAKSCGAVAAQSAQNTAFLVAKFAEPLTIGAGKATDSQVYLSCLTLGEIGRTHNLASSQPNVFARILGLFTKNAEEIKSAAAFAAGNVAVGNLASGEYLHEIVTQVSGASLPATKLLYLHSLKEAILHCSSQQIEGIAGTLWPILLSGVGDRGVKAAILGKIVTIKPSYLPELQTRVNANEADTRATVVAAIRYAFVDTSTTFDEQFGPMVLDFLSLMSDPDVVVRRLAVSAFSAGIQNKPLLVYDHLPELLPMLLKETEVKPELVKKVQMGPFTFDSDDGQPNRQAALEAMILLVNTSLPKIDVGSFLERAIEGLRDLEEVRILAYLLLHKLVHISSTAVAARLDDASMVDGIRITMADPAQKKDAQASDIQRIEEAQRSCLKTILELVELSSASQHPRFTEVIRPIATSQKWEEEFKRLKN